MIDRDAHRDPEAETGLWNVPNLLCLIRLAGSPLLVYLAIAGQTFAFAVLLAVLLITDWLDGKLAVRWHQQTRFGAMLDSVADAAMYAALVFGAAWLKWPEMKGEAAWLLVALASYVMTSVAGWWKFGRMPSYHTRAAKSCWLLVCIAALSLFAGWSLVPLRLACVAVALTNFKATAITFVLPEWQPDIPSLYHAWKRQTTPDDDR